MTSNIGQDNSNPHEIIPNILQSRYYNINEREEGKYLVQTRLQAKSSAITLQEVHGIDKGIYPNVRLEKQIIKPIICSKGKGISHVKLSLGQDRAGINQKAIKLSVFPPHDKPE